MADEPETTDAAGFGRAAYMLALGMLDHFQASGAMTPLHRERIINAALRYVEGPRFRAAESDLRKQIGRRKT